MLINTIRKLYYMRVDGIFICSKVASYVLKINKQGGQNEVHWLVSVFEFCKIYAWSFRIIKMIEEQNLCSTRFFVSS
jgi:hypothetical protein